MKKFEDWVKKWENLLKVITIAIAILTLFALWIQLGLISKEIKAQKDAQIVANLLTLNKEMYPCPRINEIIQDMFDEDKLYEQNGGRFSEAEIDNFLGYFEMIGIIEERGYLDIEIIDDMFGAYVLKVFDNKEIVRYLEKEGDGSWPYLHKLEKKIRDYNK